MAGQLLESGTRRHRSMGILPSVALHTLLILLAIRATARATSILPDITPQQRVVYTTPPTPQLRTNSVTRGGASTAIIAFPKTPVIRPLDIPDQLPPIDADAFARGVTDWDVGTSGAGSLGPTGRTNHVGPYTALEVDYVAAPILMATPRYPDFLRDAGVQGQVVVQFAIDTLGRVIPTSIAVMHSDHPQFAAAVRRALTAALFKPAEAGGRKVVELVQQSFGFVLK
jgi:protein TonB